MSALLDSNDSYKSVKIIRATWDTVKNMQITRDLGVSRRSTLIMFKGGKEVARVVGDTSKSAIEALFKAAV